MPYKVWAVNEILTAADMNTYVGNQTILSFAGTAARATAIGTAVEGMVSYLEDTDRLEVYKGTAAGWVPTVFPGGTPVANHLLQYDGTDWQSVSQAAAGAIAVFAGTAARGSAIPSPTEGMVTYRSDGDAVEVYDGSAWNAIAGGGKILQIVRATDGTERTTTSTSYVDASNSVTITPQKSDSAVILIASFLANFYSSGSSPFQVSYRITDSSNNAISGAEDSDMTLVGVSYSSEIQMTVQQTLVAYATPGTTSAVTYKLRFKSSNASHTNRLLNSDSAGQMYAIEVSA